MTQSDNVPNNIPAWLRVDTDHIPPAQAAPEPQNVSEEPVTWESSPSEGEYTPVEHEKDARPAVSEALAREEQRAEPQRRAASGGAHRRESSQAMVPVNSFVSPPPAAGALDLTPPPALDQSNLVNPVKRPPRGGWRKTLYKTSFGLINPGESDKDRRQEALLDQIRTHLYGDYRIAVMSLKGGVGKTTTTVALGGVFAETRGDRVIAIDANPDLGTLAQRVAAPGTSTIRDLLAAPDTSRYPQVKYFTSQAKSRLEVIGSERDPAVSEEFSERDYRDAITILQHHYNVILTDCGTGLMHSAMNGVLDLANTLVLVTSAALDGAQSAGATLDWLNLHGYEQLAANSVVVVSSPPQQRFAIDLEQLVGHFRSRTRAVQIIPYDPHLAEGGNVDLELLARPTREAYMQLAAIVAQDFGSPQR